MSLPTIRPADADDLNALIDLMRAAHAEAGYALEAGLAASAYTRLLNDPSRGRAWIALRGSLPVGQVVLTFKLSLESGGVDAFIEDLFVRPEARLNGIGGTLLAAAINACRERDVSAVHVEVGTENDAARALYAKHGLATRSRLLLSAELRQNRMATRAEEACFAGDGSTAIKRNKRTQFWGANADDDRLVREIIAGRKTATVCKADEYYTATGEFDDGNMAVGDSVDVFDLRGRFRCVIRVTEVYPVRFGEIPEKLWRGEGCGSATEFQEIHRRCWPDYTLTDDFEMIATHFEVVSAPADTSRKLPR